MPAYNRPRCPCCQHTGHFIRAPFAPLGRRRSLPMSPILTMTRPANKEQKASHGGSDSYAPSLDVRGWGAEVIIIAGYQRYKQSRCGVLNRGHTNISYLYRRKSTLAIQLTTQCTHLTAFFLLPVAIIDGTNPPYQTPRGTYSAGRVNATASPGPRIGQSV